MTPLFSVVIPTRNRLRTLARAIDSVRAQTDNDFEIWVVDDGDDDSAAMVHAYGDGRINYLRGPAKGVAAGRNLGIVRARGTYVAFLDADDWWYPTNLQRVREAIAGHGDVGLFYSKLDFVDRDNRKLFSPRVLNVGSCGYPIIVEGNFVANSTAVAKRRLLNEVEGFDTALSGCEDWDLWIRLARRAPVHLINEVLVACEHLSDGSFTSRYLEWLTSMDEVIAKSLSADDGLKHRQSRILAAGAYVKGKICLGAGDEVRAYREFKTAIRYRPTYSRALVYAAILSAPWMRRVLPAAARAALRLPNAR